tara:strand:+ start:2608 stop:3237 length:630 start_codon:yes stop_codon:yes gene_type:complete
MTQRQEDKYLTNIVLIVIVSGVILAYIGNYIFKSSNYKVNNNIDYISCNKSNLNNEKLQQQELANNGFNIAFTGNIITMSGILFLILLSSLFSVNNSGNLPSIFTIIKNMIFESLPSVLTFMVIIYIIIINFTYKKKLVNGDVANEYYSYSLFSSLLLLFQVGLLIKYILDISNEKESDITSVIYVLTVINFMLLGVMQVILNFFSTDG